MQIISTRQFRDNQTTIMKRVLNGEHIVLTSRVGSVRLVPIAEEDTLTARVCRGLEQVKEIREGRAKGFSLKEILDEL